MSTNESLSLPLYKANSIYVNFDFSKKNYCNYIPKINEMNYKACQKPSFFPEEIFCGINKSHNEIGSKEFLDLKEYYFCSNNDSYKITDKKDHFLINHFLHKNNKINSNNISLYIIIYLKIFN